MADSFLSAPFWQQKQYSTLNVCKNIEPQCRIWRGAEGLKSPETSHHGQRVQSDCLLPRLSPLRSAGSQNHLVKCCVPVRNEPCFGRYRRHNSSGRGLRLLKNGEVTKSILSRIMTAASRLNGWRVFQDLSKPFSVAGKPTGVMWRAVRYLKYVWRHFYIK